MDCSEAGRKGGASRSEKKRAASARNLAVARELRRTIPEAKAHVEKCAAQGVKDKVADQWLVDAEKVLTNIEKKPTTVLH